MPDNVINRLTINGKLEDVKKVYDAIGGENDSGQPLHIDFNKINPMPASLCIECGLNTDTGYAIFQIATEGMDNAYIEKGAFDRIKQLLIDEKCAFSDAGIKRFIAGERGRTLYRLGKTVHENSAAYGAKTWFEWRCREWGTKWNAYDQKRVDDNTITFSTALHGIPNLFRQLARQYPEVELEYMYADENWGENVGSFIFKGKSEEAHLPADGSDKAEAIAGELLGPRQW